MKRLTVAVLIMAFCAPLTACGNASSSASTSGSSETSSTVTTTKADEETPVKGGEVNIPISDDPTTLQGWMMRNSNESVIAPAIYETLLAYDETGAPQPYLLDSFKGDPENLTYTLVVKDGITFQDGTPLDAEAVKWNLDYYKENGVLTGSYFNYVDSVEAVDEKTVVVHMSSWDALFNYGLARTAFICSPTAVEKEGADGFNEAPIGTGPYKVTNWVHGEGVYCEKYDGYWGGQPNIDKLNFKIYASTATQQAALETGDLDIMYLSGDAVTSDALGAKGYNIVNAAIPATGYTVCFNSKADSPLADVRVRQAICYAIDSDNINQALLGNGKYGVSSTQWAVPTSSEYVDIPGFPYNVEKAKSLLAEAGYSDGFDVTINFQVGDFAKNVCQIIQQELAELNIRVNLNQIEVANYANYLGEWDGILFHPMGLGNGQFSQIAANMIPGARFGSETFLHDEKSVGLIKEAVTSDQNTLEKDLKEAVTVLFQDNTELYTVSITYATAAINPKLHGGNINEVQQYHAKWNKMWKDQ